MFDQPYRRSPGCIDRSAKKNGGEPVLSWRNQPIGLEAIQDKAAGQWHNAASAMDCRSRLAEPNVVGP